ncbi:MAG: cytochrome c [Gammaproteobacteria bacterium]|nr:cytochrome c [Gammaproteobacteria bacterium]MBT5223270.1 cytochrome c [Gammaproteobacteria bacterium]MBT5825523.1 cytochrome c [Gammaproteobacteria bacterium]MBT5966704.1 cytochrome c [Gammaproteobacteria bacterium]MBT6419045.1 cytochrome c [Gammaproteobacteria bacterium]
MNLRLLVTLLLTMMFAATAQAASIYAGKAKAAAVCAQCHGIRSTSADAPFPPLAGRDKEYLEMALKQYRDKTRVSDIMNNIAGSLSDRDINNIASYYSRLKPYN